MTRWLGTLVQRKTQVAERIIHPPEIPLGIEPQACAKEEKSERRSTKSLPDGEGDRTHRTQREGKKEILHGMEEEWKWVVPEDY